MSSVVNIRRTRRRVQVTVKVTPAERGHCASATITGRVSSHALVSANGIRWRFATQAQEGQSS